MPADDQAGRVLAAASPPVADSNPLVSLSSTVNVSPHMAAPLSVTPSTAIVVALPTPMVCAPAPQSPAPRRRHRNGLGVATLPKLSPAFTAMVSGPLRCRAVGVLQRARSLFNWPACRRWSGRSSPRRSRVAAPRSAGGRRQQTVAVLQRHREGLAAGAPVTATLTAGDRCELIDAERLRRGAVITGAALAVTAMSCSLYCQSCRSRSPRCCRARRCCRCH